LLYSDFKLQTIGCLLTIGLSSADSKLLCLLQTVLSTGGDAVPEQEAEKLSTASDTVTRFEWTHRATLLLLSLYRSHKTSFRSAKHAKSVWQRIADGMKLEGYTITWETCEKKFRNLKGTYKTINDNNKKTGRGRRTWQYFEIFKELMGNDPCVDPVVVECGSAEVMETAISPVAVGSPVAIPATSSSATSSDTPTGPGTNRKRKRKPDEAPAWFQSFTDDMKKAEEEKIAMLKKLHKDQEKSSAERLNVLKELNSNIRMLIDKL